jgi:hypothetical protein
LLLKQLFVLHAMPVGGVAGPLRTCHLTKGETEQEIMSFKVWSVQYTTNNSTSEMG